MTAQDIISALASINLAGVYDAVSLDIKGGTISEPKDLEDLVAHLSGSGWIARQSGVTTIIKGEGDNPNMGLIVSAEICSGDGTTIQVRRSRDGWLTSTIKERPGDTHLAETIQHVALDNQVAQYRRYWAIPPMVEAPEVVAWRLERLKNLEVAL